MKYSIGLGLAVFCLSLIYAVDNSYDLQATQVEMGKKCTDSFKTEVVLQAKQGDCNVFQDPNGNQPEVVWVHTGNPAPGSFGGCTECTGSIQYGWNDANCDPVADVTKKCDCIADPCPSNTTVTIDTLGTYVCNGTDGYELVLENVRRVGMGFRWDKYVHKCNRQCKLVESNSQTIPVKKCMMRAAP